ncbi:MAG: metal ABC transporter substrate-binding protein [Caldisericia bacterium]|nr:metal ABC transporter substrate-binding protein [Caldisericia bacterium]
MLYTVVIFCCSVAFCCSCSTPKQAEKTQFTILTSFYPIYVHALNVAKNVEGVQVVNLTSPQTGCLHDYTLTTNDMKAFEKASVFIVNGVGLESFLEKVMKHYPNLPVVDAGSVIWNNLPSHDYIDPNPHLWVSVTLAMEQVRQIGDQLCKLDPMHAEQYFANTEEYIDKLENLKKNMHETLDGLQKQEFITFHEAFEYFAREFNLTVAAVVESEPGSEPSPIELKKLLQLIREKQLKFLFVEPQYSQNTAQTISLETGIRIFTLDPAVTGPTSPDAYLDIMEQNKQTLLEAFSTP